MQRSIGSLHVGNDRPQANPAPDNTHWGVAYLREDSKDLRQQIVETNRQIVETNRSLSQRIDETNKCIESRFAWLITIMVALTGILIAVIKL